MPAYEPVPTDEQNTQTQSPSTTVQKTSSRKLSSLRGPLLFFAALCFTALAAFKAGQWSAERGQIETLHDAANSTTFEDNEAGISELVLNNTVDMPGNGKYSVG
jgi:hypothetical protein